jgi:adenosylhomocysteine nucleosidase
MIGIIGAMTVEIEGIRAKMTEKTEKTISGITYVSGKLGKNEVVTAVCGIGKVFAAICTQTMILEFKPDVIVNTGVAGSLSHMLNVCDIAVADKVVQHDMDTSPLGDPKGLISGINVIYFDADERASNLLAHIAADNGINTVLGTIASGDQFIASKEVKAGIVSEFGAIACEMEGAAIGHVCYVNNVPFAVLRAISDKADGVAEIDYPTFCKMAADNYVKVISEFAEKY